MPALWIHCKSASCGANLAPSQSRVLGMVGVSRLQQHRGSMLHMHGCLAFVRVVAAVRNLFALPAVLPSCFRSFSRHGTLSVVAAVAVVQRCQHREPSTSDAAIVMLCCLSAWMRQQRGLSTLQHHHHQQQSRSPQEALLKSAVAATAFEILHHCLWGRLRLGHPWLRAATHYNCQIQCTQGPRLQGLQSGRQVPGQGRGRRPEAGVAAVENHCRTAEPRALQSVPLSAPVGRALHGKLYPAHEGAAVLAATDAMPATAHHLSRVDTSAAAPAVPVLHCRPRQHRSWWAAAKGQCIPPG
mmetsp:Transcript_137486/g.274333  ORF Transcript_137486/g.274333 Transcript_137486/m.274333 type:complete len:299 (-) Transcript_137486:69-965(-)